MKKSILFLFILFSILLAPQKVWATQYGEIEIEKKISLDKKVFNPQDQIFVDNLSATQYLFPADDKVVFQIKVTNTNNEKIDKVIVRDTLPLDYLKLYDSGSFTILDNGELRADIYNLEPGQTVELSLTAKVLKQEELPQASGYYCAYNIAQAWIEGINGTYQDNSLVCLKTEGYITTKGGLPLEVKTYPEAGPADSLLILLGSGILALTGSIFLKKK
ncbi:hypothetical protein COT75_04135 [Candidatus Beckwithbacteria bacterium CG10_big_fil_rev_8_21_14_0_10_34_10]|uniref:DUF11 domain-containing protein n=1 Tax=Candidatus Beckwithbacteria bacterium CG10_big_fil_rev_8_21_14_0_10_34_10 TaxID=1974495 RepID=A0A2H0W8C3_9BACT|nr:MAG: hypothetical protein COT75_04135 [Candidatus Beckwithbacteria bacterium CG10_big_fil_rev_8_21_14_0_10_34_10]